MAERLAHHRLTTAPVDLGGPVQLAQHEPDAPEHLAAEPVDAVDDHAEPSPAELDAAVPTDGVAALDPAVAAEQLPEPAAPAAVWHQREHGRLGEDELAERVRTAETRLRELREQVQTADAQAVQLGEDIAAGTGPHTRELDEHLADLRSRAELARDADELDETRRATIERAAAAAEARALAEAERDGLGRFALRRRAELAEQITSLREQETTAQAERLGEMQAQTGNAAERRVLLTRAAAAERGDEHARPLATERDAEALERAVREADRLREHAAGADREHEALREEQRVRAQLPDANRQQEATERQAAMQPAAQHAQADLSPQHGLQQEHQVAPPELEPPQSEPHEPEL
ncbi:hypothetical protein INP57_19410 [Saccharopolyspora sp. HNM0986]|nr:hypothetical protein [Saccharopolyspora sp. HNM0986]